MLMSQGPAAVLALVAAVFSAFGITIRQHATLEVPHDEGVSTTIVRALVRKPLWWAGTASAVAGYVCQAFALNLGSLLLVQPLLVSSLLFALPIEARLSHNRVNAAEWAWALLLTAGLATFVLVGRVHSGHYMAPVPAWGLVAAVLVPIVVVCVIVAARSTGRRRAVLLAVAVAILFGTVAVLTKISMHRLLDGGPASLLSVPAPYLLAVLAVAAVVLQQSAFHAGALQTSVPTMLVLEPLVAVLLGVIVLGEELTVAGPTAALLPVSVVAMLAATIALGRDAGAREEAMEAAFTTARQPAKPPVRRRR